VALTDALAAALDIPLGVGNRPPLTGTKPFVVVWPDAPRRGGNTMKANDNQETILVCHCLGLTEESARIAEAKLATAVYGLYRTVVDGRLVQYPEQMASIPLTRDDDVNPPLYDLAVEWRLRTTPA
jgi:hypothetical protein